MASLSPSSGYIIETTELVYTSSTISAVGFSSVSWEWSLTEDYGTPSGAEDRNITITPSGMSLNVSYYDYIILFPIITIDYLTDGNSESRTSVTDWDDMTGESDIVKMQEDGKSWCQWTLDVTATGTDTAGFPANTSGTYTIRVYSNYDTNRDVLISKVSNLYASSN